MVRYEATIGIIVQASDLYEASTKIKSALSEFDDYTIELEELNEDFEDEEEEEEEGKEKT